MRLIDADVLKEKILAERDAIPLTVVERYSFGVESPNKHGQAMRGGIRKALRCMEQSPTIDPESLRPQGEWKHFFGNRGQCSVCGVVVSSTVRNNGSYCPNCGAYMKGAGDNG